MNQLLSDLMSLVSKPTTLQIIDEQILLAERALILNQGTAEHYSAMAAGNQATLNRLQAQRAQRVNGTLHVVVKAARK